MLPPPLIVKDYWLKQLQLQKKINIDTFTGQWQILDKSRAKVPFYNILTRLFRQATILFKASTRIWDSSVGWYNCKFSSNRCSTQIFQQSWPRGIWCTFAFRSLDAIFLSATTSSTSNLYQCKSWHAVLWWQTLSFKVSISYCDCKRHLKVIKLTEN